MWLADASVTAVGCSVENLLGVAPYFNDGKTRTDTSGELKEHSEGVNYCLAEA